MRVQVRVLQRSRSAHLTDADVPQAATQQVVQAGARAVGGVAPVEAVLHHVLQEAGQGSCQYKGAGSGCQ